MVFCLGNSSVRSFELLSRKKFSEIGGLRIIDKWGKIVGKMGGKVSSTEREEIKLPDLVFSIYLFIFYFSPFSFSRFSQAPHTPFLKKKEKSFPPIETVPSSPPSQNFPAPPSVPFCPHPPRFCLFPSPLPPQSLFFTPQNPDPSITHTNTYPNRPSRYWRIFG